jgi:hypothetical protein
MILSYEGNYCLLTQEEYKQYEENKYQIRTTHSKHHIEMYHSKCLMILERGVVRYNSRQFTVTRNADK